MYKGNSREEVDLCWAFRDEWSPEQANESAFLAEQDVRALNTEAVLGKEE